MRLTKIKEAFSTNPGILIHLKLKFITLGNFGQASVSSLGTLIVKWGPKSRWALDAWPFGDSPRLQATAICPSLCSPPEMHEGSLN
jgi:hypothetical protein